MKKMNKLICILLCVAMLLSTLTAFADEEQSAKMKDVLISVKEKIDVSDKFTQFESSEYKNEDQKAQYSFYWQDDEYNLSLNVNCDEDGRISYYYYRDRMVFNNPDLKRLSDVTKEDAFFVADNFLRKIVPECFADETDCLAYIEKNSIGEASLRGTYYNFSYRRMKNGVLVGDNIAEVSIFAGDKNNIVVSSASISYDYNATFETEKEEIENEKDKYSELFPAEMIYERDNKYYRADSEKKTNLIYRIKDNNIGYMSAYTGEAIIPDPDTYFRGMSGGSSIINESMSAKGMAADSALTEYELTELDTISGLKSADEIESIIKNIPYIDASDKLNKTSSRISKTDDGYIFNLTYNLSDEGTERNLRASVDAKTGKIKYIYNYVYTFEKQSTEKSDLTEDEWKETDKKVEEIINYTAKSEIQKCEKEASSYSYGVAQYNYVRNVNGVKYPQNGINISFDIKNNILRNYNLEFTDDVFEDPKNAIDEKQAYEKLLSIAPLTKLYVKSDGEYKLCYGLESTGSVKINALTGKSIDKAYVQSVVKYNDIKGHWSENAVEALCNVGIALRGESLSPDSQITQSDLLRLFAAGINYKSYMYADEKELYELIINDKIITEAEKNPSAPIKREDAFVYLIRFANLDTVAKLSSIFKTDYADGNEITKEKIGYAAILSGLGVIEGNGGYLKPQKNITRAEAASLLYKYLRMCSY